MASTIYYWSGKCAWPKLLTPDPMYNNYSIEVALDSRSLSEFLESGAQTVLKEKEGMKWAKLRRATSRVMNGTIETLGPPPVLGPDNKPFSEPVGAGSTVTCKVLVYDTKKGKGTRLEAVRVEEYIPYTGGNIIEDDGIDNPF